MLVDVLVGMLVLGLGTAVVWMSGQQAVLNWQGVHVRLKEYRALEHARIWLQHRSKNYELPVQLTSEWQLTAFEQVDRAGYSTSYQLELKDSDGITAIHSTWITPR